MEKEHEIRYRRAWELHQADGADKKKLEREMDDAQDHFTFEEFQVFKRTLPGYEKFWGEKK